MPLTILRHVTRTQKLSRRQFWFCLTYVGILIGCAIVGACVLNLLIH